MKHLVIGIRGQIGTCVSTFLKEVGEVDIVGLERGDEVVEGRERLVGEFGMVHVCIPFLDSDSFCSAVRGYMSKYGGEVVVIYSTVLPGTSERLGDRVCHSPVEGRHPDLIGGFRTFRRFVGGKRSKVVGDFYRGYGLEVVEFDDARVTELGKVLSTTRYGINLIFAAEEKELCEKYGVRYEDVVLSYQRMYNDGYKKLGEDRFIQPLLTAPEGKIGGHCVVPNAKLLMQVTDSDMIGKLAKFNDGKG